MEHYKHHQLVPSQIRKQSERFHKIKSTIKTGRLSNIVTDKVVANEFADGIIDVAAKGKAFYKSFIAVRLEQQLVGLWERVARNNLLSFSKPNPKAKTSQENDSQSYLKEE